MTQDFEEPIHALRQQLSVRQQDGRLPMSDSELLQMSRKKERFSGWDYPHDPSLPPAAVSGSPRSRSRDFRPEQQCHHPKTRTLGNRNERTLLAADRQSPIATSSAAVVGPDTVKHHSRSYNPDRGKDRGYPAAGGYPVSEVESVPPQRSRDRSRSKEPSYSSSTGMTTAEVESSPKSRMHGRNRSDWSEYPASAATSRRPDSYSEPASPQSALILDEKLPSTEKQQQARKHDTRRTDPERRGRHRHRSMSCFY